MSRYTLNVTGEICPYPMIMTRKEMGKIEKGDQLVVTVDYAKSAEDIPRWANGEGHRVLAVRDLGGTRWEIVIEKA